MRLTVATYNVHRCIGWDGQYSLERIDLNFRGHEPRGAIDVDVMCGRERLQVIATHLGLRPGERRWQVRELLTRFGTRHCILMGDINKWFYGDGLFGGLRRFSGIRLHSDRFPPPGLFLPSTVSGFGLPAASSTSELIRQPSRVWLQIISL